MSCIVADNMTGTHHSSDIETFGQGMANMAAGLLGGVTTATATMRTVANIKFGGKTPLASIIHGLTLLAILLGLGFLVAAIPAACLAAILFKVGIDILDYRILPVLKKLPITDLLVFIIVLFVTVYEDLMIAMAIGVVFAFFRFVQEVSSTYKHKTVPLSKSDFAPKGHNNKELDKLPISVLQPQGPLFFGSIEPLITAYTAAPSHEMLIVDMSRVTMIDLSGAYALEDLIKDAKTRNVKVFVSNANPHIKEVLEKIDFIKHIGKDHYMDSKRSVIPIILEQYHLEELKFTNKKNIDDNLPILHKLHSAINNHDLVAVMELYAEDAILIPAFSNIPRQGKKEIETFYKDNFGKDGVKISIYQVSCQEVNGLKVDVGMYLMRWVAKGTREEEYLRFTLIVNDNKIVSDNSSVEPNFSSLIGSNNLPIAYAKDYEE